MKSIFMVFVIIGIPFLAMLMMSSLRVTRLIMSSFCVSFTVVPAVILGLESWEFYLISAIFGIATVLSFFIDDGDEQ